MSIKTYLLIPIALLFCGCANLRHSSDKCTFTEAEVSLWHKSAVEAAGSAEKWRHFGVAPTHREMFKFDEAIFDYILSASEPSVVEVVIRCPGTIYQPDITLRITLNRETGLINSMSEVVEPPMEK